MKKNICFVEVGFDFNGAVYFPTAAGAIAAYSMAVPGLADEYVFSDFVFKRDKTDDVLCRIAPPRLAAFSCSVWNMEYNKYLARKIKNIFPDCFVVFGGHSVGGTGLLTSEPYVDALMFGEGEVPFAALLAALPDGRLDDVPNIAYRNADGDIVRTETKVFGDISAYPSPYLSGIYDRIMKENPGTEFLAVLETMRGCPNDCAYCDWCAGKNVRFFSLERVLADIRWISEHKIEYCFCADSNFGMFERDMEIAKALVAAKLSSGYPQVFRPSYAKNSDERVFEICRLLNSCGMDKGATMAYQTLSGEALENIGRKNLSMAHFSALLKKYNEAGIPSYSELILGLPGETEESFCRGICELLENGQHNSVSVYHCEVLPNSALAQPEYLERFGIEVIKVRFNHIHSAINRDEEVQEYSYLVRSTASLSRDGWVNANLFSVCVQCFHSLGLLRCFAMYLRQEQGVAYYDFYRGLLDYIMADSGLAGGLFSKFRHRYENSLNGDWNYHSPALGNVTWAFEEGAYLELLKNYDAYEVEILPFLRRFGIPEPLFGELLTYQRASLKKPFSDGERLTCGRDFKSYFAAIFKGGYEPLHEGRYDYDFTIAKRYDSWEDFAREVVWFGRRRGATVY